MKRCIIRFPAITKEKITIVRSKAFINASGCPVTIIMINVINHVVSSIGWAGGGGGLKTAKMAYLYYFFITTESFVNYFLIY